MKAFKGPRHQRGWIGIAAMVVGGVASSVSSQKGQDKQNKQSYDTSRDLSELQFQQSNWANEQARKWNLEDYQRTQNYKEDAIGSFRDAAPANAANDSGQWGPAPARTDVSADTANLAPTQANGQPLIYDPRTGKPVGSTFQTPPLAQLTPTGT